MYDDLMENDPEMQRLRAKYKMEGLAEGKAEALQANILIFIKARFPALTKQTRQRISLMANIDDLQDLFEQLVSISDEAEARELFTSAII